MKKSIRLAASILIILFLASTAFGIENQTNNTGNMTNETVEKGAEEIVEEVSGGTGEIPEEMAENVSEGVEKTPEEMAENVSEGVEKTPEKTATATATAEKTIAPTPVPTEAPGFESIFAIATILLVVYIFRIRRR